MMRHRIGLITFLLLLITGSSYAGEISINRINSAKGGEKKIVTISADSIASQISGFNLLIAYDPKLCFVYNVRPGELNQNYGWEYFTYRLITKDTLSAHMPGYNVSLINIKGMASLSGGPVPTLNLASAVLANIDVVLRKTAAGMIDEWIWFSFFWRDCNDNVLTSLDGNTIYTASGLFRNQSSFDPHESQNFPFPGFGIPDQLCTAPEGKTIVNNIDYVNAGVWTFQFDPVEECYNGDVNLNSVHYEVADLVLFINFFLYGIAVLPWPSEASIAQTDCNCDGLVFSVGDIVCFIRTALGDNRFNKIPVITGENINLFMQESSNSKSFNINTDAEIGLVYLRMAPRDGHRLDLSDFRFEQATARVGRIGDTVTMMLLDMQGSSVLTEGEHRLFEYAGNSNFGIEAWVVDQSGQERTYKLESSLLPNSPELQQNYPNPFNPSTTIEFNLPTQSDWKLEIYNVSGQLIKNFDGSASGSVKLEWNGTNLDGASVASGVYFYKLITDSSTSSRKMLLLK